MTEKDDFDMDKMTEENMAEMMEEREKRTTEKALKNKPLCNRLSGLALEGKARNLY